ncbi:MAG: hypothetical protein GX214_02255 [Clostridiales bacterium]|nr:hypothetical protein [Clostridiales bacterium]
MKRIILLFFIIILIIGSKNFTFASYRSNRTSDDIQNYLQEIFDYRIIIWNDFITDQDRSIKDIESNLKKFIAEPLLTIDLDNFKHIMENPTSYELIQNVYINNCKLQYNRMGSKIYIVNIGWDLVKDTEIIYEEYDYIVELIQIENKWLLKNYELYL